MTTREGLRTCRRCKKTVPLTEFYENDQCADGRMTVCRDCNNDRPPTEARVIRTRARSRAYKELVDLHRDEFTALLDKHTIAAAAELDELRTAAASIRTEDVHLPRLKPGPKRSGETSVIDRLDVARCEQCHSYHDRDHACEHCGSHPSTGHGHSGDWRDEAICAQVDTEMFFPEKGGSTRAAKQICESCPVIAECLQYALQHHERFGIWGGKSERERRAMQPEQEQAS